MQNGSKSTRSVEMALQHADDQMGTLDGVRSYYNLDKSLENSSPTVEKNLLSRVISGEINPEFLQRFAPMLGTLDSSLLGAFSAGKGALVLKLLSTAYTERRLDVFQLQALVDNPKTREILTRVARQYRHGGMASVNTEDLLAVVQGIDFSSILSNGTPFAKLLSQVVYHRTLTMDMIQNALIEATEQSAKTVPAEPTDTLAHSHTIPDVPTRDDASPSAFISEEEDDDDADLTETSPVTSSDSTSTLSTPPQLSSSVKFPRPNF